ncbi:palmitoyltransferase ZDHHC16-like isoform X2 [Actinia tenebrosa]|uniref:Palmitoyltransferase n=1 Tax=Actinia tenebrosa TaxID=6105 RepID=A0A6P8I3M3_ACTTE|nr:palmitoyltransferase ZDHHC16-like isoform X2 [Actinia tenebrosa]
MLKKGILLFRVGLFTVRSLAYNKANSRAIVLDAAFKPVFWVVDKLVSVLGPAFVLLVVGLISTVVIIYYTSILPTILEEHILWIVIHIVVAHWLLLNISFHYFKSVFTSPGHPPKEEKLPGNVRDFLICRICLHPKPQRTHHCSICKKCILKMDHHCPWINNCVGHFNHRYFILFCIYMCLGSFYVAVCSWELFMEHFFDDKKTEKDKSTETQMQEKIAVMFGRYRSYSDFEHNSIIFVFMLCSAVSLALGFLTAWHVLLIVKGETSIELHINKSNRIAFRKKGYVYTNPYDYGRWENWKLLLGIVNGRSWASVLWPSSHHPYGDGLTWKPPQKSFKISGRRNFLPV